jgi:hypothetical protein
MKRLIMMLLIISSSILFATSIRSIRAKEYYDSVCRLVLDMDRDTDFIVEKVADGFYIGMNQFDGNIPPHNLQGTFLKSIESSQGGLKVKSPENLGFYTLRLSDSKALVVDFYKSDQSKASRLAIARFNSDKGRLVIADRDFSKLAVDYPNHYDVFYHWGILLLKRESNRAQEKLQLIPPSSSYYDSAQTLLKSGLHAPSRATETPEPSFTEAPSPIAETTDETTLSSPEERADSTAYQLPLALLLEQGVAKKEAEKKAVPKTTIYILIAVLGFLIIGIVLLLLRKKSQQHGASSGIEESSITMDTATLTRMVNRLLADGWTTKEIAREMKTNVTEVEQVIRRLHRTGGIDDEK